MMFNQAPRCAFLLALAAGLAEDRAEGFHLASPVVSTGCGALRRGVAATTAKPHAAAVRGCTCGACVAAAAGFWRTAPGGRARSRGYAVLGMSTEAGEVPDAAVPEFELSDKAVDVSFLLDHVMSVCAC